MDYYFTSIWFKVSSGIVAAIIIYGIAAYFLLNKKLTESLPMREKTRLTQSLPKAIFICKIMIFLLPLYLFVIPPIYALDNQLAYQIMAGLTAVFAGSFIGLLLCTKLLNAIR